MATAHLCCSLYGANSMALSHQADSMPPHPDPLRRTPTHLQHPNRTQSSPLHWLRIQKPQDHVQDDPHLWKSSAKANTGGNPQARRRSTGEKSPNVMAPVRLTRTSAVISITGSESFSSLSCGLSENDGWQHTGRNRFISLIAFCMPFVAC